MIDRGRYNVLGVRIDAVDYDAAIERIATAVRKRRPLAASALAVHGVMTGVLDPVQRVSAQSLRPGCARRATRSLGAESAPRHAAAGAGLRPCAHAQDVPVGSGERGADLPVRRHSRLVGSSERTAAGEVSPVADRRHRPSLFRRLSVDERDQLVAAIRASGAALTFVGLGCPRQEVWAYEFREALSMPLVAVGAAFPFLAGQLPQAPEFMQRRGLEWLYRLSSEPRRLWKRYVLLNPLYLALLAAQWTGLHRFSDDEPPRPAPLMLYG